MDGGAGLTLLAAPRSARRSSAPPRSPALAEHAQALARGAASSSARRPRAAWATGEPDEALANATPYLQAFGHVVLAWIWLDVALCARRARRGRRRRSRGQARRVPLLLPLRAAEDRRLARRRRDAATTPAGRWPRSRSDDLDPAHRRADLGADLRRPVRRRPRRRACSARRRRSAGASIVGGARRRRPSAAC